MARKTINSGGDPRYFGAPSPELSLESILEEYRAMPVPEESEAEPIPLEEEDGILSAEVPEEDYAEDYPPEPLYEEPEQPSYEEEKTDALFYEEEEQEPSSYDEEASEVALFGEEEEPELFIPETKNEEEAEPSEKEQALYYTEAHDPLSDDAVSFEELEDEAAQTVTLEDDFEDTAEDDLYADILSETEEEAEKNEKSTSANKKPRIEPKTGLRAKLVGLLAASSYRRSQQKKEKAPEPENVELEMPPQRAAKYYAAQMPSLKLRCLGAVFVTALLAWITFSADFGWRLPGGLEEDLRLCSLVSIVGLLTVMLIGLDVFTAGMMALLRGRPGAESLLAVATLTSLLDCIIMVAGGSARGVGFCAAPAAAYACALLGAWFNCRGYKSSFLAAFHAQGSYAVTTAELGEKKERYLIKSRRGFAGFVRRSEEPDGSESLCASVFWPLLALAAAISLACALGSGDIGAFFRLFAMMTAVCASPCWLFSFPLLFDKMSRYLLRRGAALAGWSGAHDVGESGRLILTDTDIFPEGTVEITGIRLRDRNRAEKIIAYTGSMLCAAGTGTASVFAELMRRNNSAMEKVESFTVGDGGVLGEIDHQTVRVGTAGYMYLNGVKIDDKMKAENAVYTAVGNTLEGVFLLRYRTVASVQRALYGLRKARRKPVFATRDFNLEPLLLQKAFGVSTEGFAFPAVPERFRISAAPSENETSPVAGILAQEGLDALVDLTECGSQLFTFGRLCSWACLISAVLGMIILLIPAWKLDWVTAGAGHVLLYALLWLIVPGALSFSIKK